MELPQDIMNNIKSFLPPHPLQFEIATWSRKQYFYKSYFNKNSKKKDKIERFIKDNDFWIDISGLSNEDAVKLKHKCFLDKHKLKKKLNQMNLLMWHCIIVTHIPTLNKHGNYSEVFYKGQEIIY